VEGALETLAAHYAGRGIELRRAGRALALPNRARSGASLRREREDVRRLSRAATEALAIIAYHEPVSRAEIEAIRGVQTARGTLDVLMEAGWVHVAGRREGPGRPTIYATTPTFLAHFGLETRRDLPGIEELRAAGLLDPVEAVFCRDDGGWIRCTRPIVRPSLTNLRELAGSFAEWMPYLVGRQGDYPWAACPFRI